MIHAARQLGCFDVQGVTGEADHTEEPGQSFGGALLGPVARGTLGIGVDQQDAAPLPRPLSRKVQRARGLAAPAQIGSGWCRARVGQTVWIAVWAAALKKKKQYSTND